MSVPTLEEFRKLAAAKITTAPTSNKANWDAIFKQLVEDTKKNPELLFDIKTIYEAYVKGVVSRLRTKNVLQDWLRRGKCLGGYSGSPYNRFYFYFGTTEMLDKASRPKKATKKTS